MNKYKTIKQLINNDDNLVFESSGFEFLLFDVEQSITKTNGVVLKFKAYNEKDLPFSLKCLYYSIWANIFSFCRNYLNITLSYEDKIEVYDKGNLLEGEDDFFYIPEYVVEEVIESLKGLKYEYNEDLEVTFDTIFPKTFYNVDVKSELISCTLDYDNEYRLYILIDLKLLKATKNGNSGQINVIDKIKNGPYSFEYKKNGYFNTELEFNILGLLEKYKSLLCSQIDTTILVKYHI